MEFWLTDGIFHRAGTLINDTHGHYIPCYEDTGKQFILPEDATTVTIPEGTVEIGIEAFAGIQRYEMYALGYGQPRHWKKLKKVILPGTVKKIDKDAFSYTPLAEINFPDGLESIGLAAFSVTRLTSVKLPDSITAIDEFCFDYCDQLKELIFPASFVDQHPYFKQCFSFCTRLEKVEFAEHVNNYYNFYGCSSIKKTQIPYGTKAIEHRLYNDCTSLEEVSIPETVTVIGYGAFQNCKSLTQLTIPSSVKKVDSDAFSGCSGLQTLTINYAFKGFEAAFPDSHDVRKVFISESSAAKAKVMFPKAEIYNLKGKLLSTPQDRVSASNEAPSSVINGELIPKSKIPRFVNYQWQIEDSKRSYSVRFRGAQTVNRTCKALLTNAAKNADDNKVYDAQSLAAENVQLYIFDHHTGVNIEVLSMDYEGWEHTRKYCNPLDSEAINQYVRKFTKALESCLTDDNLKKIIDFVPHKKNGTLYKNRVTLILKSKWADETGHALVLLARNASDTELDLEIKKIYIGESKYEETEAGKMIHCFR